MAKVKIQGHASGTGVITLTAPNTSTDRTVTLPDADITLGAGVDGIVSSADATAMTITSAEKIGIGTGSPDSIVEIEGASPILTITDTDASGANFGLWIRELGSHGMPADGTAYGAFLSYKMADNKFQIQMRNGSTTYDSLTVARADGNVGIGQTSPSSANSIPTFLHIGNSSTTQSAIVLEDDESKWEIIHNGDIAFRVG